MAAELSNTESSTGSGLVVKGGNNSSTYSADFRDYNNISLMRVRGDGNVGIGVTSPDSLLHLQTNVNNTARLKLESTAANSYPYISFKNDAREYGIYGAHGGLSDAFSIYDNTAGAHRLTIDSSGEVGIGTTAPSALLEVSSSAPTFILNANTVSYTHLTLPTKA